MRGLVGATAGHSALPELLVRQHIKETQLIMGEKRTEKSQTGSGGNDSATVSVFISSPGDLGSTRKRVAEIIRGMGKAPIGGKQVTFEPMLWEEKTPAIMGFEPQEAIDAFLGEQSEMGIYVGMFCCQMGSPTTIKNYRYKSGTRYEFEKAYDSFCLNRRPLLLLYRRTNPRPPECGPKDPEVDKFFASFRDAHSRYQGIPKSFETDDDLEKLLGPDLKQIALRLIQGDIGMQTEPLGESAKLVKIVREWLETFEDRFGKKLTKNEERERDHPFPVRFRYLGDTHSEEASSELLPRENESLVNVFDRMGSRMMFVGDRGTGKTFGMLKLMKDLTDRAFLNLGQPVPVFFNLSSWSKTFDRDQQPSGTLNRWLEDEIVGNYSVPRKTAKQLLESNRIILCLDGLDELVSGAPGAKNEIDEASRALRDECLKVINDTLEDLDVRMILCCREGTYRELKNRPRMGTPLQPQPLSDAEIKDELSKRPNLEGLREAMTRSRLLLERARNPLFLSLMCFAFREEHSEPILKQVDRPDWEKYLLDKYVGQCLRLASDSRSGPIVNEAGKDAIHCCLSWLASQADNDFLLDSMQPSLLLSGDPLSGKKEWKKYRLHSVSLLAGALMVVETIPPVLATALVNGASAGWHQGIIRGLIMLISSVCILFPLYYVAFDSPFSLLGVIGGGFCFGLAWSLDCSVYNYLEYPTKAYLGCGTVSSALRMLLATLPCGVIFFVLITWHLYSRWAGYTSRYQDNEAIKWHEILPIEPRNWKWRRGIVGLPAGPIVWLIGSHLGEPRPALIAAPLISLMVCMFSGLSGSGISKVSIEPNQGIVRSLRHALLMAGLFGVLGSLCWGGVDWYYLGWINAVEGGCLGLTLLFAFFVFGGIPVIRQYSLGMVLHKQKQSKLPSWRCWPPWDLTVAFLNKLVDYKLLRRSAGGYMFRHDILRKYYKARGEAGTPIRSSGG